jgi:branched-chain amino acid aminotransferase
MSAAEYKYIYLNDEWTNAKSFNPTHFSEGITIYEVIRVIDGIPLFIEEHLVRLESSAQQMIFKMWHRPDEVQKVIHQLILKNKIQNGNIQILFNIQSATAIKNSVYQFIPSHYPDKDTYAKGVKSMLFFAERDRPGIKKTDTSLRNAANQAIQKNGVYEVILVDKENNIGEGSRSNVFFIKGDKVITAPNDKVLAGVTRQRILDLCGKTKIPIIERSIKTSELMIFDAAFFSGTSPKVLPISNIGSIAYTPMNELLQEIIKIYNKEIKEYLASAKSN